MLKRKIYEKLLDWKSNRGQHCLLIKGARQVGKTYIVREFGKAEYESFIEINFLEHPEFKIIFDGDRSAETIFKNISYNIPNVKLVPHRTLLFLDEIQKCANARTALKFLAQDERFDVIASGSLLGLAYGRDDDKEVEEVESIPVGYEKPIMMYPLDFEEFLWAYGYGKDTISYLKSFYDTKEKVPEQINEKYLSLIREYIVVGGMPEVVADFMENKDFSRVQEIQDKVLASYADDISQHAKGSEKVKVRSCYDSIPRQLARENKKFKYSEIEKKATARKFGDSIQWLSDASMVNICLNTTSPQLPLKAYEKDNEFKVYMNDTGLLMALYGFTTKQALLNNKLKGAAKGGIYENLVAQMLIQRGYSLHYYKPDDNSKLEFVIEKDMEIAPVEVKAGNTATVSLDRFIERFGSANAYKVAGSNVGINGVKLTIPHYMVMFL